ncbi:cytochrome P450 [Streptomyces sp. NPDC057694]|uniref:cytochrome P450 n=1 Tax=Streptomyces sp. NPDC057694 TaxID=3346216 RepID=UPI0036CEC00E
MTGEPSHHLAVPFPCPADLGEPPELAALRAEGGLHRLPTSAGDEAWLVTSHDLVRNMCGDPRVGRAHQDPPHAPRLWDAALMGPRDDHADEATAHARWRQVVSHHFSSRQIARLRPRVERVMERLVDARLAEGPPMDVRTGLAEPFAAAVICDVLGLPHPLTSDLVAWSDAARRPGSADAAAAWRLRLRDRMLEAVEATRARASALPDTNGMLADFALASPEERPLCDDELVDTILDLFLAGYDTVATRMVYGTAFLLNHPDQLSALRDDASLVPGAVEEIVRLAVPGGSWMPRYARRDMPLPGASIKQGDLIVLSFQSANQDEQVFTDAARFDISRHPNPHIAFGRGTFYCVGAALARLELAVHLTGLARFPGLAHADPARPLRPDRGTVTGGLESLMTTWDGPAAG